MNKFDLIISDWAGTTVDYGSFAPIAALVETFKEAGITPTTQEVRGPMGKNKKDHIFEMLEMPRLEKEWTALRGKKPTEDDVNVLYGIFNTKILDKFAEEAYSKPLPYVVETIDELRKHGVKIGSNTGYTSEMMSVLLPKAKELGYDPSVCYTSEDIAGYGRPYPYMIFKCMKNLEIKDVHRVIKIGDTIADIEEGKNAGVFSCGVIEGSSEMGLTQEEYEALSDSEKDALKKRIKNKFLDAGADQVFNNFKELGEFVLGK